MLNDSHKVDYRNSGVIVLRSILNDWIEILQRGVERNLKEPGEYAREYVGEGENGRFFGDYCNWNRIEEYHEFLFESPCASMAAELMESDQVRLFHEHILIKEPGTDKSTPWHHDQPYYCVNGRKLCSFWIPLDPVPVETCPEFVSGSHNWGQWFIPRRFIGTDYENEDPSLVPVPDIDAHREDYDIISWELEPGDAIAFHSLTLHSAPPNISATKRRRGFSARWLGDDAIYAKRSGVISPPFPGLEDRLQEGDPMEAEEFPVVWPS